MNYTDRHLTKDISNKAFKRKYGVVSQKSNRIMINKDAWMQRILRKNPWLKEPKPLFDSLQPEDQAHLDSIKPIY